MNNSYLSKVPIENVSNMLIMHYQIKNLVFKAIRSIAGNLHLMIWAQSIL